MEHTYHRGILYGRLSLWLSPALCDPSSDGREPVDAARSLSSAEVAFVEDKDRRILENKRGLLICADANCSGQTATPVAYIAVIAMLRSHYEVMGIGLFMQPGHLWHSVFLHAECYIVVKRIVKQYCLLADIAHQRTQTAHAQIPHIVPVDLCKCRPALYRTGQQILGVDFAAASALRVHRIAGLYIQTDILHHRCSGS